MHLPLSLQWLNSHKGTYFVGNFTPWMTTLGVSRWGQKVKPVCLVRVRLEVLISTFFSECRETLLSLHVYTTPHHVCAIHALNLITFPVIYLFFSIVLFANFWDLRATFTSPISHTYELISFLSNHLSGCEKSQTEKKVTM